jgi:hypothetical protein
LGKEPNKKQLMGAIPFQPTPLGVWVEFMPEFDVTIKISGKQSEK